MLSCPTFCIFVAHAATVGHPLATNWVDLGYLRPEDLSLRHKLINILVITDGVPSESLDGLGYLGHQPTLISTDPIPSLSSSILLVAWT
jgi:hypothetical protein